MGGRARGLGPVVGKDVLIIADDLHTRGIALHVLTGTLDGAYTPTGEGKFFFTVMAAFAELERDLIHQRTVAGLDAARRQGRVGGRPTVMDADKIAAGRARRARGESPTQIAKALGVSRATYYRHLTPRPDPTHHTTGDPPTPADRPDPAATLPDVDVEVPSPLLPVAAAERDRAPEPVPATPGRPPIAEQPTPGPPGGPG